MSTLSKLLISIAVSIPAMFVGFILVGVIATLLLGTSMIDGYETINGGARSGAAIVGGGVIIAGFTGWYVYKILGKKPSIKKH